MAEKFLTLMDKLQTKLKQYTSTKLSWGWICLKLLKLLGNYPSGVTMGIILSELHNEAERTGGKITSHISLNCTKCTVDSIVESRSVAFKSVLETTVSSIYTIPNTTTKIIRLSTEGKGQIEMYLHKKFYHIVDILSTHTLRLTCCRLVPSMGSSKPKLRLIPTEHLVILLSLSEEIELKESERFKTLSEATVGIKEQKYCDDLYAKVTDIGEEEVLTTSDGSIFRRVTLQLVDHEGATPTPFILWDTYTMFARLLTRGDKLFVERPFAKPGLGGQSFLEYAPGTIIYLAPYTPEEEIVPSQHPSVRSPVLVTKTDQGQLDYLTYPHRLLITNLVPNIVNAVMLLEITSFEQNSESRDQCWDVLIHAKDPTGAIIVYVLGMSSRLILLDCEWVVVSGLETLKGSEDQLCLSCDLSKGGKIYDVPRMQGWQSSQ